MGGGIAPSLLGLRVSRYLNYKLQTSCVQCLTIDIFTFNRKNYKLCFVPERSILTILKSRVDEAVPISKTYALYEKNKNSSVPQGTFLKKMKI